MILINDCQFQGRVVENPSFDDNGYGFFTIKTKYLQRFDNGQFTEVPQDIVIMVEPDGPVNVVKTYVKSGKSIHVHTFFKTLETNGEHRYAFVVKNILLG